MHYTYNTKGTCSMRIEFDINEDVITNVSFMGGCNGNLQGVSKLVEGMKADEIAEKLKGITCGMKPTSCPDQLATAVLEAKESQA